MPGRITFNIQKAVQHTRHNPGTLRHLSHLLSVNAQHQACRASFVNAEFAIDEVTLPAYRDSARAIRSSGLADLTISQGTNSSALLRILRNFALGKFAQAIDFGAKKGFETRITHNEQTFPLTWRNLRQEFVDRHIGHAPFEFRELGLSAVAGAVCFLAGGIALFWGFHDYFADFLGNFQTIQTGPDEETNGLMGFLSLTGGSFGAAAYSLFTVGYNLHQKIKSIIYNQRFFASMNGLFACSLPQDEKTRVLARINSANSELASSLDVTLRLDRTLS